MGEGERGVKVAWGRSWGGGQGQKSWGAGCDCGRVVGTRLWHKGVKEGRGVGVVEDSGQLSTGNGVLLALQPQPAVRARGPLRHRPGAGFRLENLPGLFRLGPETNLGLADMMNAAKALGGVVTNDDAERPH